MAGNESVEMSRRLDWSIGVVAFRSSANAATPEREGVEDVPRIACDHVRAMNGRVDIESYISIQFDQKATDNATSIDRASPRAAVRCSHRQT